VGLADKFIQSPGTQTSGDTFDPKGVCDPATMKHKSDVLDEWCAKVGRDPKEIVRSTTITRLGGERREPEPYLELGFTDFVVSVAGPDWDLTPLREALAWRDTLN